VHDEPQKPSEWILFDIEGVRQLRGIYVEAMASIRADLPNINLNSRREIINFFEKTFQITLQSSRIAEITSHLNKFKDDSKEYEIILGIIYYFKMKYAVKNYLDCILKHEKKGVVELRTYFGSITMPNRQPLPKSPEILECVIEHSDGINLKGE